MKKFALGLSLLISMGLGMLGCGDSGCLDGEVACDDVCIDAIEPTLTSIQPGVFDISCTASPCHDANVPAEMLDLSSVDASESNLIDVDSVQVPMSSRVAPGDSDASYLMNKLLGVDMAFGTTQMPQLALDGLCQPKIDVIREWIDLGAPR
jgi:hypothetical protein